MSYRIGSAYYGTSSVKTTSTTNEEIIPKDREFYKFSFLNLDQCTVSINGSRPILLAIEQGFECNEIDVPVHSFVIIESSVSYQYIGAY